MDTTAIEQRIVALIAQHEAKMAQLVEIKPAVTYAGSDGRRVKYVRSEQTVAVLTDLLAELKANR